MKSVFADTLYWGALISPRDPYHTAAEKISSSFAGVRLVTTEEVLTEFLDSLSGQGPLLRAAAAATVRSIMSRKDVVAYHQSHASFLAGLRLYESRVDKGYSLVDCISMQTMRREKVREVLTNDRHFEQEGFVCLLK